MSVIPDATSQPGIDALGAFERAVATTEAAPPAQPLSQAAPPTETPQTFDPATIAIPDYAAGPTLEKFRGKHLGDVVRSYEESQRAMHQRSQEAAQARRENEELKTRLAVAEQIARMNPAPAPAPPADIWTQAGVNPDVEIINNPRGLLELAIAEAERRARVGAAEEAGKVRSEVSQENEERERAHAYIGTWDAAKAQIRALGHELTDQQWVDDLGYIMFKLGPEAQADPSAAFTVSRYVDHFTRLRGAPSRATLPTEGAPPVASRAAAVNPKAAQVPTLPAEQADLAATIYRNLQGIGLVSADQANTAAMRMSRSQR